MTYENYEIGCQIDQKIPNTKDCDCTEASVIQ